MRRLEFLGRSQKDLQGFPRPARKAAGDQLFLLQAGQQPDDWKPMPAIGPGVTEIRVRISAGAYRVIYVANLEEAIYVLHCFQKKSEKTSRQDVEIARNRFRELRARR